MDSSSSSSSRQLKHQVFLSFRGEDTRHNFTSHLLKALKDKGLNVFFDEETLEKGEELFQALSKAIAASNMSIIVLSVDYASSKSCLAELSETMDRKRIAGQIVLPIFYHVNPSDVRNLGGSFKTSFDEHESKRPHDEVRRWKDAFAKVGKLKGWHIEGGIFDKSEPAYISVIVEYVIKKLNSKSTSGSEELVGIDDQKETILRLIEQEDNRVIGIWGMGGIGKTTLAGVVHKDVSPKFAGNYLLLNVRDKLEKQGGESLRNELLSKVLDQENFRIHTLSIDTLIQERLNNKRVFVVLDDVNDSDLIDYLGVKHFGHGSKILVTSRDQQVLKNGGVDKIHEVKKLNEDDSLQLFSKFAFKQLNPVADFRDLSNKFVKYAQGNPLALKVLGSNLYQRTKEVWESALDTLKGYPEPKIFKVLRISFDGLEGPEDNIFLDIACFFNGESKDFVVNILSCCYNGALYGISNLVDKCLLDSDEANKFRRRNRSKRISMHDLLQEMGRDVVRKDNKDPGKRSRLWSPADVYYLLKHDKGTESVEGIMLDMSQIDELRLRPTIFENMLNLRYIKFYFPPSILEKRCNKRLLADEVDIVSLPDELRCLWWDYYPFKSLSSSFNPKNLVVLRLRHGDMEQLWNEDLQGLVNLREIDLSHCKNLRKIPNLSGAIKLESLTCDGCESLVEPPCLDHLTSSETLHHGCYELKKFLEDLVNLRHIYLDDCKNLSKIPNLSRAINLESLSCIGCESLVELPCLNHLTSLEMLDLRGCCKLKKFPEVPDNFFVLVLENTGIEEVPDSIEHLLHLGDLRMSNSRVKNVSSNISKLKSLYSLNLNHCPITKFPEVSSSITSLDLCETQIEEMPSSIGCLDRLWRLNMSGSSIQSLQCNVDLSGCPNFTELNSGEISTEDVPLPISRFENLKEMKINHCNSLKLLSDLPPRLEYLDAHDCTSLEEVSFTDQYLYNDLSMNHNIIIFSNCSDLSQDSVDNIVANAMLRIGSLAKLFERRYADGSLNVFCCLPGNEISAHKFKDQSMNSSLVLKIGPNNCSGSRFLAFALCLVVDLKHRHKYEYMKFMCEYQLKATSGDCEKFKSECWFEPHNSKPEYLGDHLFILFSDYMVKKDKDYEEASFEFYIKTFDDYEDDGIEVVDIKVKKCGVHVFYVDAESYTNSAVESSEEFYTDEMSSDESYKSFDSKEDANIEEVHDDNY